MSDVIAEGFKEKIKKKWSSMSKKKKIPIVLASFVLFAFVYVNLGHLYGNLIMYSIYYPKSTITKILIPIAPFSEKLSFLRSPFSKTTPEINSDLKNTCGSFEKYRKVETEQERLMLWIVCFLWPFFLLGFWFLALISWIVWLAVAGWTGVCFIFKWAFITGGPIKALGLMP